MKQISFLRRCAGALLAAVLLLSMAVPAAASVSDFRDVSSGAWYYDAVAFVTDRGLFRGTGDTTFSPSGTMTRGMFITVLGRLAGIDPDDWAVGTVTADRADLHSGPDASYQSLGSLSCGEALVLAGHSGDWYKVRKDGMTGYVSSAYVAPKYHAFSDVGYDQYYAGYTIWGYENGIIDGMGSSDVFAPNRNVTREQICKMLGQYASSRGLTLADNGSDTAFADQGSISSWAADGVRAMQRAGVVQGEKRDGGYVFRPASSATRAEAAAMFQRFSAALSAQPADPPAETAPPQESPAQEIEVVGDYNPGSIYGEALEEWQLRELQAAVADFLRDYYDPSASDYDNVKAAHDYLVDNVEYSDNYSGYNAWSAWAAIIGHRANCIGYVKAFKALCDAMGIACYMVPSNRTSHRWNKVQVDGAWYNIDVQGNDLSRHNYWFLVSDDILRIDGYSWDTSAYPACPASYSA